MNVEMQEVNVFDNDEHQVVFVDDSGNRCFHLKKLYRAHVFEGHESMNVVAGSDVKHAMRDEDNMNWNIADDDYAKVNTSVQTNSNEKNEYH